MTIQVNVEMYLEDDLDMAQEVEPGYPPLPWDAKGLRGRRARIIVEFPSDSDGWVASFPEGTREVVIDDDEPNIYNDLRVYVPGYEPANPLDMEKVRYDQLSLLE